MRDLIEKKALLKEQIEELESAISAEISRIVRIFKSQKFEGDSKFAHYHDSAVNSILGNHLIPEYFDTVEIDEDEVYAHGTYYGSHGYAEGESIHFPTSWLGLDDEKLAAEIQLTWLTVIDSKQAKSKALEEEEKRRRKEQYEALKAEFG